MLPVKILGAMAEVGVLHNKMTTSSSTSATVSSTCDQTVCSLDSDQRHDLSKESLKKITGDALEDTVVANSEIRRSQKHWNHLGTCKTAGKGIDLELRLAPKAVAMSFDLNSVEIGGPLVKYGVKHNNTTSSTLVGTQVSPMCDLTVRGLDSGLDSDRRYVSPEESLKQIKEPTAGWLQLGSNFGEELGITFEMLANTTNATKVGTTSTARYGKVECSQSLMNNVLSNSQMVNIKEASVVEDNASSEKQSQLVTPDSEVDLGIDSRGKNVLKDVGNLHSVELESLRPLDTGDDRDSDTSMSNLTSLQNEDSRVAFGIPKPIKNTDFVELGSCIVPERKSGHQVSKSIELGHVSKFDTKRKGGPSYKAKRENHHISSESLSSRNKNIDNKRLRETSCSLPTSRKRKLSSSIKNDVHRKKKVARSSETFDQNKAKDLVSNTTTGKFVSDASEPRRSSRKIQPTSRLLEGLETSFIIKELLEEEDTRTQHRSNSSRLSEGLETSCILMEPPKRGPRTQRRSNLSRG